MGINRLYALLRRCLRWPNHFKQTLSWGWLWIDPPATASSVLGMHAWSSFRFIEKPFIPRGNSCLHHSWGVWLGSRYYYGAHGFFRGSWFYLGLVLGWNARERTSHMLGNCSTVGLYPQTFNLLCICMCLFLYLCAGTHRYQKREKPPYWL